MSNLQNREKNYPRGLDGLGIACQNHKVFLRRSKFKRSIIYHIYYDTYLKIVESTFPVFLSHTHKDILLR